MHVFYVQINYHYISLSCLAANENGTPCKQDLSSFGQKKIQTSVRMLRGHSGAVTALHCVTRREVWDLVVVHATWSRKNRVDPIAD